MYVRNIKLNAVYIYSYVPLFSLFRNNSSRQTGKGLFYILLQQASFYCFLNKIFRKGRPEIIIIEIEVIIVMVM